MLAPDSGGRIKEMSWVMFVFDSAELVIVGAIKRLLPIWIHEIGLFFHARGISSGRVTSCAGPLQCL
jgi:hypothetical protein